MIVSFFRQGGAGKRDPENWKRNGPLGEHLFQGQRDPSPEIKQKVAELTASAPTTLAKMPSNRGIVRKHRSVT